MDVFWIASVYMVTCEKSIFGRGDSKSDDFLTLNFENADSSRVLQQHSIVFKFMLPDTYSVLYDAGTDDQGRVHA